MTDIYIPLKFNYNRNRLMKTKESVQCQNISHPWTLHLLVKTASLVGRLIPRKSTFLFQTEIKLHAKTKVLVFIT